MASRRRSRSPSAVDALFELPWQLNALLTIGSYIILSNAPAFIDVESEMISRLIATLPLLALPLALFFLLATVVTVFRRLGGKPRQRVRESDRNQVRKREPVEADIERARQRERDFFDSVTLIDQSAPIVDTPQHEHISVELLQAIEWKRFEALCRSYLEAKGAIAKESAIGADGGIDLLLFQSGADRPYAIAQCDRAATMEGVGEPEVGEQDVRELFGVMAAEGVGHGIYMTAHNFSEQAKAFARGKNLILLSGADIVRSAGRLEAALQTRLLAVATEGDYTTPTCPNCDIKMVRREPIEGGGAGKPFWGCANYPRCSGMLSYKAD